MRAGPVVLTFETLTLPEPQGQPATNLWDE